MRDPAMELRNILFYAAEAPTPQTPTTIHLLATAVEQVAIHLEKNAIQEDA